MSRQDAAVARLTRSRSRLRGALVRRSSGAVAAELVGRLVQQHPLPAAALAALAGAFLARSRPWRWLLKAELWTATLPAVMSALASAPAGVWSSVLAAVLAHLEQKPSAPSP